MITSLETSFEFGDFPTAPVATDIALEAEVTEAEALAMIQSAWQQAETFTGRTYRDTTDGKIVLSVSSPMNYQWPRYPFPELLTTELYVNGAFEPMLVPYIAELGLIEIEEPFATYRLIQEGTVIGRTPPPNVIQAVTNLALYQLINAPARREFKSQSAGDTSFSREALKGVMFGSGAGALLASEVRL